MLNLVRYGGLNPYKQKGNYTSNEEDMSFHTAPERYGCYAFIEHMIEMYLLGGTNQDLGEDENGKWKLTKRKTFKVDGEIWSHIYLEKYKHFVIEERGAWYKYNTKDFKLLIKKQYAHDLKHMKQSFLKDFKERDIRAMILSLHSPYTRLSKDHLEVFIPRGTKIK